LRTAVLVGGFGLRTAPLAGGVALMRGVCVVFAMAGGESEMTFESNVPDAATPLVIGHPGVVRVYRVIHSRPWTSHHSRRMLSSACAALS